MPGIPLTQIKNGCAEPWFKRNRSWPARSCKEPKATEQRSLPEEPPISSRFRSRDGEPASGRPPRRCPAGAARRAVLPGRALSGRPDFSWWTSAELNRGLTDLDQAFYMLSLWSIPPFSSPQTNSEKAGSRKSPLKGRKQTFESVPH